MHEAKWTTFWGDLTSWLCGFKRQNVGDVYPNMQIIIKNVCDTPTALLLLNNTFKFLNEKLSSYLETILKQVSLEQMLNWFYWQKNCETIHNQVAELASCEPLHGNPIYWTTDARLYKIAPLQLRLLSLHLATHPPSHPRPQLYCDSDVLFQILRLSHRFNVTSIFFFFLTEFVDRISRTQPQCWPLSLVQHCLRVFFF